MIDISLGVLLRWSCLNFIFVIQNINWLSIFNLFRPLFQFQLEQSVRNHTNSNVNRLDVILYFCDWLLDVLKWAAVTEWFSSVFDLTLSLCQFLVYIHQLCFQLLHVLWHLLEVSLDFFQVIRVSSIISCHSLERSCKDSLFFTNFL